MVHTTPIEKGILHESWHVFIRGMCLYCGWHCDDCPVGVATCKCPPTADEVIILADRRLKEESTGITDSWRD